MKCFQVVHVQLMKRHNSSNNETTSHRPSNKKKRSRKRKYLSKDAGVRTILTPKQCTWYIFPIINGEVMDKTELKDFCNQFRMPYENFKELLQEANCKPMFAKWAKGRTDCYRQPSSPLSLLLLGALWYLGRGGTFDDCQASSFIHKEIHRHFFHLFLKYRSSVLYDCFIVMTKTPEEAKRTCVKWRWRVFLGACQVQTQLI